jgi:hypothetical protein
MTASGGTAPAFSARSRQFRRNEDNEIFATGSPLLVLSKPYSIYISAKYIPWKIFAL